MLIFNVFAEVNMSFQKKIKKYHIDAHMRVEKMCLFVKYRKDTIIFNLQITINDIQAKAESGLDA